MKNNLLLALKLLLLTILYLICFAVVAAALLPRLEAEPPGYEPISVPAGLLMMSLLNTAVLIYMTLRSRWSGAKLIATTAIALFGVTTVMPQIETAVFIRKLPPEFLPRLIVAGFIFSVVFAILVVLIVRKRPSDQNTQGLSLSIGEWIARGSLIAAVYVVIYFTFGYFVAWRNPVVREYYGGGTANGFIDQIVHTWETTPWLFPFQFLRGLIWLALAVPVIKMLRGGWVEKGFVVALLFGVVMNTQLLLPNPLMPFEVRVTHLLETASSNFIFGWILVALLIKRRSHLR